MKLKMSIVGVFVFSIFLVLVHLYVSNESSLDGIKEVFAKEELEANKIYFNSTLITYLNGGLKKGEEIAKKGEYASTWGGVEKYSGTDDMNTHFIGKGETVFDGIEEATTFTVTDSEGTEFQYEKIEEYKVNKQGKDIHTGENRYYEIVGLEGGEIITLQTDINDDMNLIIIAEIMD